MTINKTLLSSVRKGEGCGGRHSPELDSHFRLASACNQSVKDPLWLNVVEEHDIEIYVRIAVEIFSVAMIHRASMISCVDSFCIAQTNIVIYFGFHDLTRLGDCYIFNYCITISCYRRDLFLQNLQGPCSFRSSQPSDEAQMHFEGPPHRRRQLRTPTDGPPIYHSKSDLPQKTRFLAQFKLGHACCHQRKPNCLPTNICSGWLEHHRRVQSIESNT